MKFSARFAISVGRLMLLQWAFFLITGNVPELQTEPFSIAFHLAAELMTALTLILSGVLLLNKKPIARILSFLSSGWLIYTTVNSSGYFAQSGDWVFVGMFAVLFILTCVSIYRISLADK